MKYFIVILSILWGAQAWAQDEAAEILGQRAFNLVDQACRWDDQDLPPCLENFVENYEFNTDVGIEGLTTACDGGENARACYYAGVARETFQPQVDKSMKSPALKDYQTACENGFLLGCTFLYQKFTELPDSKLQIQGQMKLTESCYGGESRACRMLGDGLSDQRWETIYNLRSMSAGFNQKCNDGNVNACSILGYQDNPNFDEAGNLKIQAQMLSKSCAAGVSVDCLWLGSKYQTANDLENAEAAFRKGCALSDDQAGLSCEALGAQLADQGQSEQAFIALEQACFAGLYRDCLLVDTALLTLAKDADDMTSLLTSYEAKCNADEALGCLFAGRIYGFEEQTEPQQDLEKAKAYFEKSCSLDLPYGCMAYAVSLAGPDRTENPDKVLEITTRACDLGDPVACKNLGNVALFVMQTES